jgi:hypothetical protein
VTAASVILPRRNAALRLLYLTDLLLKDTTLSVTAIALDLLKAVVGRETAVVKLLSFNAFGAELMAFALTPKGHKVEAANTNKALNNIVSRV